MKNLYLMIFLVIMAFVLAGCPKEEPKPDPPEEPKVVEPEPEIKESSTDPFEGIKTEDITNFAELFNVPPPEDDKTAYEMAKKIRKWIADGRPK